MNSMVTKKMDREQLFLTMGFCLGFHPDDEPAETLVGKRLRGGY